MDREALVLPVAQGMAHDEHPNLGWNSLLEAEQKRWLSRARAALAVAEPAVREDERDGIAADVDCGCAGRDAVLSAESKADRWRACPRDPCAAVEAAVIRARSAP